MAQLLEQLAAAMRAKAGKDFPVPPPDTPQVLYSLVTDDGGAVVSTPATPIGNDPDGSRRADWRKTDDAKHKPPAYPVDETDDQKPKVNDTTANCHGTTFGGGGFYIDINSVGKILLDNYLKVNIAAGQKARVCDVIVWGGGPKHSALVVEVGDDGKPSMVIGKNGDLGRLWAHPPDDYGTDWEVYGRRNGFDGATQKEIDDLKSAYKKAKDDSDADPKDEAKRKKAHLAAYALCRRKNKLKEKP